MREFKPELDGRDNPGRGEDNVNPIARPMLQSEASLIIDYFHHASPEFLASLGVDPARLPPRERWRAHYEQEFGLPVEKRRSLLVLWELAQSPIGFSSADKIVIGSQAFMHLHIFEPHRRQHGHGVSLVRQSARIYFETLGIQQLFCEPYALNAAPNRTLQKAGFKYVMTHETVPGPLNFHQPVNRWVLARGA
jgi:RimJ/RimL family protein N-acetyltransferase